MKRNIWLVLAVLALAVLLLKGIPLVAAGIAAHGVAGANYGGVVFPVLLGAAALYLYRKQK